jgi:hypothetical protein
MTAALTVHQPTVYFEGSKLNGTLPIAQPNATIHRNSTLKGRNSSALSARKDPMDVKSLNFSPDSAWAPRKKPNSTGNNPKTK